MYIWLVLCLIVLWFIVGWWWVCLGSKVVGCRSHNEEQQGQGTHIFRWLSRLRFPYICLNCLCLFPYLWSQWKRTLDFSLQVLYKYLNGRYSNSWVITTIVIEGYTTDGYTVYDHWSSLTTMIETWYTTICHWRIHIDKYFDIHLDIEYIGIPLENTHLSLNYYA